MYLTEVGIKVGGRGLQSDEALNETQREIHKLADGLDLEESDGCNENDGDDDDNEDGWVDERGAMSRVDRAVLDASVQPVRLVLVKVSFTYLECHVRTLTHQTAPKASLFHQKLLNADSSCLVQGPREIEVDGTHHAKGCCDTLEFHL